MKTVLQGVRDGPSKSNFPGVIAALSRCPAMRVASPAAFRITEQDPESAGREAHDPREVDRADAQGSMEQATAGTGVSPRGCRLALDGWLGLLFCRAGLRGCTGERGPELAAHLDGPNQ